MEIIKVNEDNHSERIPNTTFEIRKVDDALVDTVTTDKNGRVFVALEDGSYYAKEVTSNKSFRLDDTPHYFEIKDGKHVTLQVTNKKLSGIVIHKIDSATGEGIYGVKFVLYDANKKPIGEYTSDDEGYIYIDEIPGGLSGRFYLRELEAAPGYTLDKQYKTASNVKPQQAGDHMARALGTVAFTLPYSAEVESLYLAGDLLGELSMKDSRVFRKEIEKIAKEVFGC